MASPTGADQMTLFYSRWAGHGASTPSTPKRTLFRITGAVAASTSASLITVIDVLWAGHVTSSPNAAKGTFTSFAGGNASTSASYAGCRFSVLTTPSTILLAEVGIAVEVASPSSADEMAFLYARWTGHVTSTSSTHQLAPFSFTCAEAISTSTDLIAIFYTLRTSHVTSTPDTVIGTVTSIAHARRPAADTACVAGRRDRDPDKRKWQQSEEQR